MNMVLDLDEVLVHTKVISKKDNLTSYQSIRQLSYRDKQGMLINVGRHLTSSLAS